MKNESPLVIMCVLQNSAANANTIFTVQRQLLLHSSTTRNFPPLRLAIFTIEALTCKKNLEWEKKYPDHAIKRSFD